MDKAMDNKIESKIEVRPGRKMYFVTYKNPNSDTTVFLIHGLGGRGEQWQKQIEALKNQYTLIVPDLLGHGKSDKPNSSQFNPYSFSELDQDMHAFFNLYADNKNIILGHSYGGALTTSLSLDYQDKINKFILIAPTPCAPGLPLPWLYRLPVFLMEALRPYLERQFQTLAFSSHPNPEIVASELEAGRKNPMYVIKFLIHGMQNMPSIDLTMLNIPALVIVGEPDGLVPASAQQSFYKNLPNHEFNIITDASHMVLLEKPEIVNQSILKFTHKLDG
jgi:pimeloyl-ACP methyl ester carboxylesterase